MKMGLRYTEDREEAGDVVNLSFMKILNSLNSLDKPEAYFGWAKQIGLRTAIDELRKNKKYRDRNKYIIDKESDDDIPFEIESLDFTEDSLEVNAIFELINKLPPMQRQVLNLVAIDGYAHKECAEILGISESNSRQILNNARKQMAIKIKERNNNSIPFTELNRY
jgi:RNA polymerase sigma factor (sigma-70 family)